MSSNEATSARVVPAHLDFLAIYNPSLGPTDDTEKDQIVFYWSGITQDAYIQTQGGAHAAQDARNKANEQLRQIGLAQGIVHFASGFANGEAVDSIDTEKHRIVLHQIEEGWWILASISLTILPTAKRNNAADTTDTSIEYSSREVSPPPLLLAQLSTAHRIFELHHGPSLSDLYSRVKRQKFCNLLDIYWTIFARDWDVLLHGNPAVDIYNGIKLAAGGELGMGVGEEEWGSGERDALEGLVRDTDGLVDLVASRFGHATQHGGPATPDNLSQMDESEEHASKMNEPWLGSFRQPDAVDGIVFTGVGSLSRFSLRSLSAWMNSIYTNGENAYGVLDNPTSGRRNRRRRLSHQPPVRTRPSMTSLNSAPLAVQRGNTDDTITERSYAAAAREETGATANEESGPSEKTIVEQLPNKQKEEEIAKRDPDQIAADQPKPVSIPPPIVSAAEDALKQATEQAEETARKRADQETTGGRTEASRNASGSEKWAKYLTLGYGSSWSIPGLQKDHATAKPGEKSHDSPTATNDEDRGLQSKQPRRVEASSSFMAPTLPISASVGGNVSLSGGRFLIGLKGDLNAVDDESGPDGGESESQDNGGDRIVLRTIHVGVNVPDRPVSVKSSGASSRSRAFYDENGSVMSTVEVKRLRVVVYVNQPFIFTFLFDASSAFTALSAPSFFRKLHTNLAPLHKPLLASTSPSNVASRLTGFLTVPVPYQNATQGPSPIYDLVYDPYNLTVHTSIPNIPLPGTLAAEGLAPYALPFMSGGAGKLPVAPWTRVEALNVHSQILNAVAETRRRDGDREHQAKTSRGWWVVWMRLTATATYDSASEGHGGSVDGEGLREAVLVRRASDHTSTHRNEGSPRKASSYGLGRFVGRDEHTSAIGTGGGNGSETESGSGSRWGPGRITEGIGVDARKYVESLLSLNR